MEALTLVNSLISEREEKLIVRTVKRQRTISSQDIKEFTKVSASTKTVKRVLYKYGYASRIAEKKQFISVKNRKARLRFARKHKNWTVNDWKEVLWSDESMFTLHPNYQKDYGDYHQKDLMLIVWLDQ